MTPSDQLGQLPAKSLRQIVDVLSKARESVRSGKGTVLPLATFVLRSGQSIYGWVIDERQDGKDSTVLVHLPGGDLRAPTLDVAYVPYASIEAILVHQANDALDLLSDGELTAASNAPVGSTEKRGFGKR